MKVKKYRKKPIEIEAIKWNGSNFDDISNFATNGKVSLKHCCCGCNTMTIKTLEGIMQSEIGDYIIKGVKGEFYPCKPDIFELTYEEIK